MQRESREKKRETRLVVVDFVKYPLPVYVCVCVCVSKYVNELSMHIYGRQSRAW